MGHQIKRRDKLGIIHLVRRHEVPNEQKDRHDDMLGDRDHVRAGHFQDLYILLDGRVEVDVVGANTSSHTELEVLRL